MLSKSNIYLFIGAVELMCGVTHHRPLLLVLVSGVPHPSVLLSEVLVCANQAVGHTNLLCLPAVTPQTCTLSLCKQQITDEGLITICRGCHRLQSLCVSGCANITDAILHALGQNCPRLR